MLAAAIGMTALLGDAGRAGPLRSQNQPASRAFRIIGDIYWVGGDYGSYLITTPQGYILYDTAVRPRRSPSASREIKQERRPT